MYPNGLDPAPVAAVLRGTRTWAARVRPQTSAPGAPRVLELGEIAGDGAFNPHDLIPTGDAPTDVSLVTPAAGAAGTGGGPGVSGGLLGDLWITWADASGSWLERLHCP
jgi:hypothetical protein